MSRRSGPSTASQPVGATDILRTALLVVVGGLVTISWLSPTEGAINGDTVPRAIVWMLVAAGWLMLPPLARRFAGRGAGGEGASDFSSRTARSASDGGSSPAPSPPSSGERVGERWGARLAALGKHVFGSGGKRDMLTQSCEHGTRRNASEGEHAGERTAPSPYPSPPKTGARGPERESSPPKQSSWWAQPSLLADLGVALFVGGHVLSGLIVLATTGQRRFAANLLAEWLGLGCAWIVLREVVAVPAWRSRLTATLLAAATAAAGLGIWQHQVTLPNMALEYGPKIVAVREALARGETHPFMWELSAVGVPTSEPGLTLYEKRLRDSREPFGMFALANTLGGLLASALVWGAACLAVVVRSRYPRWWLGVATCVVMAVCLVFTKSRTASVAVVVGLLAVGYHALHLRGWSRGRMIAWCGAGLAGAVLIAAAAFAVGVWDREVLAEAPKSLGYRWLYWQGTGRLIAERPLLGVGLGQFRPAYLRVKLPEASEEIADPHNVLLEAWVNGGLLAVVGLLLCGLSVFRRVGRVFESHHDGGATWWDSKTRPTLRESSNDRGGWGVIGGGALAHVAILVAGPWDDSVFALGVGWACGVAAWTGLVATPLCVVGSRAALLTLGVHLLGAGGGGMPAVLLWGLILLAMSVAEREPTMPCNSGDQGLRRAASVIPTVAAGLVIVLIWRPDAACQELIADGDRAIGHRGLRTADGLYVAAADRDPWNPVPRVRSGELRRQSARGLQSETLDINEMIASAILSYETAIQSDPNNGDWRSAIGRCWFDRFQSSEESDHATNAAHWFQLASTMYPTNSAWAADWAEAAQAAGQADDARRAAEIALTQDDINRRLGHVERWLPEARRKQLEAWR